MSEVRRLLINSAVRSLVATDAHVITVPEDARIDQCLKVLAQHRILSAPIAGEDAFVGFVDVRDILKAFSRDFDVEEIRSAKMLAKMRVLEERGASFAAKALKDLADHGSDGDFVHENKLNASIAELIDSFLNPTKKGLQEGSTTRKIVHRMAVFNKGGSVTGIVSQSDIIRFVTAHTSDLGQLAQATVSELGWGSKPVISVPPETPAFDAMLKMDAEDISALAVVSAAGKLIGNFSMSELRTIVADHFGSLALPVGEFLALEHGTEYYGYVLSGTPDAPEAPSGSVMQWAKDRGQRQVEVPGREVGQHVVCCNSSTRFEEVLALLTTYRLHRLYVVDEALNPIGLITLTDILRKLSEKAESAQ